jgi:hypothetical protein
MSKSPKKNQTPLELFQEAYGLMYGKHTKYTAMDLARPKYYAAHKIGTLDAYLAASHAINNALAEKDSDISKAKKLIRKAVNKCILLGMNVNAADATAGSSAAGPKAVPGVVICDATAAAYAQPILPAIPMQQAAVSIMSPAPRKLEFDPPPKWSPFDKAVVFTSAAPREAPPPVSIVDKTQRVLMSASAHIIDGVRGMFSAAAPDVGQKRLVQHDAYSDRPKKAQAVGGAAAGKAPAKQVLYAKMNGVWDEKVVAAMEALESRDIYKFDWIYPDAQKELSTLPRDKAVECLRIMRVFKTDGNICNANNHFVSRARLMRDLYYLKSADEIFQEQNPKDETGNDTEDDDTPPKVQVKADADTPPKVQVKADADTPPKVQVKAHADTEPKVQVKEECVVID